MYISGILVSTANNFYPYKFIFEVEYSLGSDSKATWVPCMGYELETNPKDSGLPIFKQRMKAQLDTTEPTPVYSPLCIDFFNSEKFLLPNTNMRLRLSRSQMLLFIGSGW